MASTYLTRTPSSSTNNRTFTLSVWVKRAKISDRQAIIAQAVDGSNETQIWFDNDDTLLMFQNSSNSTQFAIRTNRLFRDTTAWYHIVMAFDTTQATDTNRVKLYINGVQETSFNSPSYPSQNFDTRWNSTTPVEVGRMSYNQNYFDGVMSHLHWIDGTQYSASNFGSTDATTGEWKINTNPNVTYGTNGFFILKDGNSVTDQSGNSNNFTVGGGTLTKTEDNPSNNFAILNRLSFHEANFAMSNGNTVMATGNNTAWNNAICATLVATGGKFYWEAKWTDGDSYSIIGIIKAEDIHRCATSLSGSGTDIYMHANAIQTDNGGGNPQKYSFVSSDGNISISAPPGCIMQFALDCENRKFWFGVNGTYYNSGNPATGANPTWDTTDIPADGEFVPYAQGYKISGATAFQFNFGNGFFGSTAISSEGTNASNLGKFEYDVPSGFTALCTKGLNL